MKRKIVVLLQTASLFLFLLFLFVTFRGLPTSTSFDLNSATSGLKDYWLSDKNHKQDGSVGQVNGSGTEAVEGNTSTPTEPFETSTPVEIPPTETPSPSPHSDDTSQHFDTKPYTTAIMTPEDKTFKRLDCPAPESGRYNYLRNTSTTSAAKDHISYIFMLDLYQCADLLPRLIGSIVEAMRFLGPSNCALSIVEGRSDDGTYEVLHAATESIESIGAKYYLHKNDTADPKGGGNDRIQVLADLRNQAFQPLSDHSQQFEDDTTIIFINDVALCMEDILELVHQRRLQGADMVCAMDWTYVGPEPTFYDVWIARGMNGDTFFEIPPDGSWNNAYDLFWNSPEDRARLDARIPFQVFACWNGATAFTAKPFLKKQIQFRNSMEGECYQGEPELLCKDMWNLGYGKIAVIPSVNVEYSDEASQKIKASKGYVSKAVAQEDEKNPSMIMWEDSPPKQTKCMPNYNAQHWVDWDEHLTKDHIPLE